VHRKLIGALALLAAYVALGFAVTYLPLGALDRSETWFAGRGVPLAAFFTRAGSFIVYASLCALTILFGTLRPGWFGRSLAIVGTLLAAWVSSDLFKAFFQRARPDQWFAIHESSFGYASGHATLALAFYGLWAYVLWRALPPSPGRSVIVVGLGIWIALIGWSRLALGAHYPTDLLGGYLLGAAWLLLAMSVVDRLTGRQREVLAGSGRER
jgi:undecaprenyl-diphosphatase